MSTVKQIPVERLWELYEFNPLTGKLWSKYLKRYLHGRLIADGRLVQMRFTWNGKVYGTNYGAVTYAWCAGAWASPTVDHYPDRNPKNNRSWNLRPATYAEQNRNRSIFKGGVRKIGNRWYARMRVDGKTRSLGGHATQAEAQQAYSDALNALEASQRGS